jgi:hypothetical protein
MSRSRQAWRRGLPGRAVINLCPPVSASEGDRAMFLAIADSPNWPFPPKNGPVPGRPLWPIVKRPDRG